MRRIFSKKDQAIREAFQIYDSAKVQSVQEDDTGFRGISSGEAEEFLDAFEESRAEERIFRLIEKLPIENPKKKARRIWIGSVAAILFCVLAGCILHYVKEKPVRATRALQEVYRTSGVRMGAGNSNPLATSEGLLYQCHDLTEKEQRRLRESGVTYQKTKGGVSGDFSEEVEIYRVSERESRQFILVKDGNDRVCLGKFIGYHGAMGALAASQDAEGKVQDCSTGEILEKVMSIRSPKDIRTVTLERGRGISKEDPQRMVAMWTREEERAWFYEFFSEKNKVCSPYPASRETEAEVEQIKREGMPVTFGKGIFRWKDQLLEKMPDQAYYLEIENQYRELFTLGLVLENDKVEVWLEPLEEWMSQTLESGEAAMTYSPWVNPELAQAWERNGIICLSQEKQKQLSQVMGKVLEK